MKFLFKQTFISIILFFVISFLSILPQIHPLTHVGERHIFEIGFPFVYYFEWIDKTHFLVGWKQKGLFLDCMLVWSFVLFVSLTYRLYKRK